MLYEATVKGEDIMILGKMSSVIPNWLSVCQVSDVGVVLPNNYWCFKECHNSETSLFTSQHVITFQKILIFINTAMRCENVTCRGLFFYFPGTLQANAAIVPVNDYDCLLPKVLSNDKTRLPLTQMGWLICIAWDCNIFTVKGHTYYCGLAHGKDVEK